MTASPPGASATGTELQANAKFGQKLALPATGTQPAPEAWAKNPAALEWMAAEALRIGDIKGVEAAFTLLALADPKRCDELMDDYRAALAVMNWLQGSTR